MIFKILNVAFSAALGILMYYLIKALALYCIYQEILIQAWRVN